MALGRMDKGDVVAEADRDGVVFNGEDDGCVVGCWVINIIVVD